MKLLFSSKGDHSANIKLTGKDEIIQSDDKVAVTLYSFLKSAVSSLKVKSCKLYNNKYMIVSTQATNTEIFAVIILLVFTLLSRKVLFRNRKDNRNC